jgi:predicted DNA-binding ribbon-helix-helix protein
VTTEQDALQATLAAEHAAVYVLTLIGSRTSASAERELYTALRAAYEAHRESRDALIGEIAGLDTTDGRYQAALAVEHACASTYAALVGATSGDRRLEAIGLLNDVAARELSFRGTPEIFPGADEYADR